MTMPDPAQEFQETQILGQGLIESFELGPARTCLRFDFPKRFDIQFIGVMDYRAKLPLGFKIPVRKWSASRDSEYLRGMPERYRHRHRSLSPRGDLRQLCHFHMSFHDGYLDVLAEDYVFTMVSR